MKALLIKALLVDTSTNKSPKTDFFTFKALLINTCELDTNKLAILIDTNKLVETNKLLVKDTLTFNTLILLLLFLYLIPTTGFR
jgi:hypothetical protein